MDKQKQIEEMAKESGGCDYPHRPCEKCWCKEKDECGAYIYAKSYHKKGYRKIPENAVVLTEKEYKRYKRIEETIRLAKMYKANGYEVKNGKLYYYSNMLGGCEIEFKDLQEICDTLNHYTEEFYGLNQRITFWQGKAEETRKETAEKFAERLKALFPISEDVFRFTTPENIHKAIDEICKEITEGGGAV